MIEKNGNRTCSIDTDTDGFAGKTSLEKSEEFLHHPLNKKQGKIEASERLSMHDK